LESRGTPWWFTHIFDSAFTHKFREVDRAVLDGESEGLIKLHVKKGTDQISNVSSHRCGTGVHALACFRSKGNQVHSPILKFQKPLLNLRRIRFDDAHDTTTSLSEKHLA